VISGKLRHITDNPKFALFELVCVFVACGLWYIQPQLGWWPLLIALSPAVLRLLVGKQFIKPTPLDIAIAVFMVTAGIGVWAAFDREIAWAKFWFLGCAVLIFYALSIQPQANQWIIASFFSLIGILIAVNFLLTHNFQIHPAKIIPINQVGLWWMSLRPSLPFRSIHPNVVAGVIVMFLPLTLSLGIWVWHQKRFVILTIIFIGILLSLLALLLTTSRGAWMALVGAIGVWFLWGLSSFVTRIIPWSRKTLFGVALVVIMGLGVGFAVSYPGGVESLANLLPGPARASNRLELVQANLKLMSDSPFTGSGLGSFPGLYSQYILVSPFLIIPHGHNSFLDVALEQGLIGLIALVIILFGGGFLLLRKSIHKSDDNLKYSTLLRWAVLTSLFLMIIHGLFDDILYHTWGTPLRFVIPGMAVSLFLNNSQHRAWSLQNANLTIDGKPTNYSQRWKWKVVAIFFIVVIVSGIIFRDPLLSKWYANLGTVEMARIELAGWPTGKWDDGSNVADLERAESLFHQALTFNSNNRTANHRLGLIAMYKRDYPSAISYLETAYQIDHDHRGIRKSLGYSYLWSGQYDQAISLLSEFPDSGYEVGNYIGWWDTLGRSDLSAIAQTMVTRLEAADPPMPGDNPTP